MPASFLDELISHKALVHSVSYLLIWAPGPKWLNQKKTDKQRKGIWEKCHCRNIAFTGTGHSDLITSASDWNVIAF